MPTGTFGLRTFRDPAFRRIVILVLCTIAGIFRVVQLWVLSNQPLWANDFGYFWKAAVNVLHGEPMYPASQLVGTYIEDFQLGFLYPPPLAVAVTPLAALLPNDFHDAAWVWAALGAAILVASVVALVRSERLIDRVDPALALGGAAGAIVFVAAAFILTPVIGELSVGNVHLELLGLFTLAWLGVRRGDQTGERVAGLAIAVAALVKVFPALLVVWFLATGRRTAAIWAAFGVAALVLLSIPIVGVQPWLDYPRILANMGSIGDVTDSVSPTIWLAPIIGFDAARFFVPAVAIGTIVAVARVRTDIVSFAVAVTVSVLATPAVFHHYLAILVLPLLLAIGAGVRWWLIVLVYLLLWGGQQPALGDWAWVLSRVPQTIGYLLLIGVLVSIRQARRATSPGLASGSVAAPTGAA